MEIDIGEHCSVSNCRQIDFLPFICDCCNNVFCLQHRSYNKHSCPKAGDKDYRIIHCPLCKIAIRLIDSEDPNISWENHMRSGCNPQESNKKKKKRCIASGCKEVLVTSNFVKCSTCQQDVCLRHRFPNDHQCPRQKSLMHRKTQSNTTKKIDISTSSEECPICNKKFRYVSQLVAHVDKAHKEILNTNIQTQSRSVSSTQVVSSIVAEPSYAPEAAPELCPHCNSVFADIGQLIVHVEQEHTGRRATIKNDCLVM